MGKRSQAGLERERERDRQPHRRNRPPRNWTRPCRCGLVFTSADVRTYCCAACPARVGHGPHLPALLDRPTLSEVRRCRWCECVAPFGSGRGGFCSERCANASIGRAQLEVAVTFNNCRRCGSMYCSRASTDSGFCSSDCGKREQRKRRKAERRANRAAGESFTLREIAERDGWRCHLCGKAVPDRPYSARDDDPTIDHLVPVSAGGTHERSNVALAHNRCNWERGDKGLAQLRLVG